MTWLWANDTRGKRYTNYRYHWDDYTYCNFQGLGYPLWVIRWQSFKKSDARSEVGPFRYSWWLDLNPVPGGRGCVGLFGPSSDFLRHCKTANAARHSANTCWLFLTIYCAHFSNKKMSVQVRSPERICWFQLRKVSNHVTTKVFTERFPLFRY